MKPTSVSQVLEAAVKLAIGLSMAIVLKRLTQNIAFPAGGAIFGVTMSCLVSSFYLNHCFRKSYRDLPVGKDTASSG
jgi:hypothetical protein